MFLLAIGISLGVDHMLVVPCTLIITKSLLISYFLRTSAYISKSGNFVTTASIELPQAWKDFARSLLRVEGDTRYKCFCSATLLAQNIH